MYSLIKSKNFFFKSLPA